MADTARMREIVAKWLYEAKKFPDDKLTDYVLADIRTLVLAEVEKLEIPFIHANRNLLFKADVVQALTKLVEGGKEKKDDKRLG